MADIFSRILGAAANRIEARQKQKKTEGNQRLARYDAKTQSYVYLDGSPVTVAQVLTNGAIADGKVVSATKGFIDAPVTAIERRTERKRRRAKTGEGIAYIYTKTVQVDRPGTVFHGRDYTGIFFVDREGNTQQLDGEITVLYRTDFTFWRWNEDPPSAFVGEPVREFKVERQCPFIAVSISWTGNEVVGRVGALNWESTIDSQLFREVIRFVGFNSASVTQEIADFWWQHLDRPTYATTLSPIIVSMNEQAEEGSYVCSSSSNDFFFLKVKKTLSFSIGRLRRTRTTPWTGPYSGFSFDPDEDMRPHYQDKDVGFAFQSYGLLVRGSTANGYVPEFPLLQEGEEEKYPGIVGLDGSTRGFPVYVSSFSWPAPFYSPIIGDGIPYQFAFYHSYDIQAWKYFLMKEGTATDLSLDQDDPSDESAEDWRFPSQVYEGDPDWDDPCFEQFSDNKLANLVGDTVFTVATALNSITNLETPVSVQVRPVTRNGNSCSLGAPSTAQIKLKVLLPPDSTVIAAAVIL